MDRLNLSETHMCECEKDSQTIGHILMYCTACRTMFDNIEHIDAHHSTPYLERKLFWSTLLHPKHSSTETTHEVRLAVAHFLKRVRL